MIEPAGSHARLVVRDVFSTAWPLFQVCLPRCVPLALIAIVISNLPVGQMTQREWWGVLFARTLLVLICYGAMLRLQLGLAAGEKPSLRQSLSKAVHDLPAALAIVVVCVLPFLPAMASTLQRGFDWLALLLTAAASAVVLYVLPAWPAMIVRSTGPWTALITGMRLVRGHWAQVAALIVTLLSGVLVFILLAGISIAMLMNLAGQGANPSAAALAVSRWLIDIVAALPVVYAGTVGSVTWRALAGAAR